MALTLSNMMELGTKTPNFELLDTVSGKTVSLADMKSEVATVVIFICNHCPYVKHINAKLV
jgi:peroxiredoxin